MKSCHKTLFTIPTCSPLTYNCITDCVTLFRFNSPHAAYTFETKTRAYEGFSGFSDSVVVRTQCSVHQQNEAHVITLYKRSRKTNKNYILA